ncbi:MAG: hypothetical protein IJT45_01310 [Bacteroidales bacterium]|nr:hypothetical protein [Bacteroidales bacterium]MCR5036761.1 hypothetical protein [Bacteroidales bacterium]
MRRLLVIALSLVLPLCACAQKKGFKLVEKSGPKPEWVGQGSVKDYIIVQSDKPTLEEAKSDAMQKVRTEIAASVATNVMRTVNSYTQKVVEGNESQTNATMSIESTSKIARMPAIQGVSITKADTYQELFRNKKTGEVYYNLYVKYPFSQFDLVELVTAYELHEKEIDDKIKGFEDGLDNIESVEQIDANILALNALEGEIGAEDARTITIEGIVKRYNKIYDNIIVDVVNKSKNKVTVRLVYNGNTIATSQKPRTSSNCATQFTVKSEGDNTVINFDSEYCYDQDDNYVEVRFKVGPKFAKEKIFFK